MSIGMTPFHALYGYDALSFANIVFVDKKALRAKDWILESQDILKDLKDNLQTAQNQQKMYADKNRVERHFIPGVPSIAVVPAIHTETLANLIQNVIFATLIRRVGEVACELELPTGSRIYNIFHVSCLKRVLGQYVTAVVELPPLDDEGHLILELEAILETRERKLKSKTIREYLVRWKSLPHEDVTWKGEHILEHPALKLFGDKQHLGGEDYHVPS
eukprot:PITA_02258